MQDYCSNLRGFKNLGGCGLKKWGQKNGKNEMGSEGQSKFLSVLPVNFTLTPFILTPFISLTPFILTPFILNLGGDSNSDSSNRLKILIFGIDNLQISDSKNDDLYNNHPETKITNIYIIILTQ